MNMNKKVMATALLVSSAIASFASQAADGTINFTGNITDTACTVTPATANQSVNLGTIKSDGFSGAGSVSAPAKFSVVLSSCPTTYTAASVRFDGPTATGNSNLLALSPAADAATGVALGIYESDASTAIPVGTSSVAKTLATGGDTTLDFFAKYVATADKVTAGTANAVSNFTISYN